MSKPPKPIPVADELSSGFWQATEAHHLAVQKCAKCGWCAYPPNISCVNCQVDPPSFEWWQVSGNGRVKTWTIIRDSFLPGFADEVPFVIADVELVEQDGLRMVARLNEVAEEDLVLGLEVKVAFSSIGDGPPIPHFVAVRG